MMAEKGITVKDGETLDKKALLQKQYDQKLKEQAEFEAKMNKLAKVSDPPWSAPAALHAAPHTASPLGLLAARSRRPHHRFTVHLCTWPLPRPVSVV